MSAPRKRETPRIREARVIPMSRVGVVRLERVAEARRRIAEGWYDRADVRDSLVEAVMLEIRGH
ncbi:MAG: hypothetical protein K8R56_00770 [Candidatus Eisenbacteria bacterium]|nr:hypothetical protein [Candidatus Eisenbacteria bacterium]